MIFQEQADDCLAACVATIMQRPLSEVYYEAATGADGTARHGRSGEDFFGAWYAWAKREGWKMNGVMITPCHSDELEDVDEKLPEGLWIAGVLDFWRGIHSPHAIVMRGREVYHDPAPIGKPPSFWVYGVITLEPMRPLA